MYQRLEKVLVAVLAVCVLTMTGLAVRREIGDARVRSSVSERAAALAPKKIENGAALASVGRTIGNPAATITLVEFSDFECPYCAAQHASLGELLRRRPDVRVVYRHYPGPGHRSAEPAAIAAECAAEQGRFPEFADVLFRAQDSLAITPFDEFAKRAGVTDLAAFQRCRDGSAAARAAVKRDVAAGNRIGIMGTPTLLLGDEMLTGASTLEGLEEWIDSRAPSVTSLPDSVRLVDDTFPILAKPVLASRDRQGRLYLADRSDRDVKVYAADGRRVGTVGQAGRNAGQFTHLSSAEVLGDSVVAYNFQNTTLSLFSAGGRLLESTQLRNPPFEVRSVDDSLLLLVRHPGMGGELLGIARPDGEARVRFYAPELFPAIPQLRFFSGLMADAHAGFVFAGFFGNDTLHVFDYAGKEIVAQPIPSRMPLQRIDELLARNGGKQHKADSSWFHDGMNAVLRVVALDGGAAAIQIAKYDAHEGTDLLRRDRPGEIVVVRAVAGRLEVVQRLEPHGMLLGRDRDGALIVASRAADTSRDIMLVRRRVL